MGINYSGTIERMKQAAGLKNNSGIARAIGVSPQALSNYKKKGEIPSDLVVKFAMTLGLSVNWLITGEGGMTRASKAVDPAPVVPSAMNPEERLYAGKLIRILRGKADSSRGIKNAIDAFLNKLE